MAHTFESWGRKYGLLLALALGLLVWLLPTPAGMTVTQHKLLSLFAAAVALWVTIGVNFAVSSFFVVSGLYFWVGNPAGTYKAGHLLRDANFAVSGYGSPALFLLVTGFVISIAMTRSGVARRIALLMMRAFGRTPRGAVAATRPGISPAACRVETCRVARRVSSGVPPADLRCS